VKLIPIRSKDLEKELSDYKFEVSKKDIIQIMDDKIILINKIPFFFYHEKKLVPTLKLLIQKDLLQSVYVDQGAIKFVIKGADIMRPGITAFDSEIKNGDFIVIKDSLHKKPLAVGISLYSSEEISKLKTGIILRNIHFLGDDLWKISL
jgi:PUA domain protein